MTSIASGTIDLQTTGSIAGSRSDSGGSYQIAATNGASTQSKQEQFVLEYERWAYRNNSSDTWGTAKEHDVAGLFIHIDSTTVPVHDFLRSQHDEIRRVIEVALFPLVADSSEFVLDVREGSIVVRLLAKFAKDVLVNLARLGRIIVFKLTKLVLATPEAARKIKRGVLFAIKWSWQNFGKIVSGVQSLISILEFFKIVDVDDLISAGKNIFAILRRFFGGGTDFA